MQIPWKKITRWSVRLGLLAGAVAILATSPLPLHLARAVPALSPLAIVATSLARRGIPAHILAFLPALVMLGIALWRGRWFCRWVCPLGTVYELPKKLSFKKPLLRRPVGGVLFWAIIAASLAGAPTLLWLDPLSTFHRLGPVLQGTYTISSLILGIVVPVFLILGAIQPRIWCTHFCPLGYALEKAQIKRPRSEAENNRMRRDVLIGLAAGIPVGLLAPRIFTHKQSPQSYPILPPGAKTPERFADKCTRCYNCVSACPSKVISVRYRGGRGLSQLLQPELDTSRAACEQFCNFCTQVCPTGALEPMTEEEKQKLQIGTAHVIRDACLAWADHQYCMVCDEYCPYNAIRDEPDENGIPRPVVDKDICRGCGYCQNKCPAIRQGKAIKVQGIPRQKQAKDRF